MDTTTLLWLALIAIGLLLFILGSIIYALYKQLGASYAQLTLTQKDQQAYHIQAESFKSLNNQLAKDNLALKNTCDTAYKKIDQLQADYNQLMNEYTELNTASIEREKNFKEQLDLLNHNKQQLKLEFEQLAAQIFEAKGKVFNEQNQQSLHSLLSPFREQIKNFQAKVEEVHLNETAQKAALNQELKQLKELNQQITQETHDLTLALKGDKKMQGNWGELILENILSRAGLEIDRDFYIQKQVVSADGNPQRPDVIIQLPQNKHLIIDAKVSLNAYTRSVNAESDDAAQYALKEHVKAINQHIKTLSERFYFQSKQLNSPELVIMFIPIEPAFIAAFKADEMLFQKAIDQHILVATPTTLLACLQMVKQLWRLENQSRNTLELSNMAGKVYDKLRGFLSSMDKIEKSLQSAQDTYQDAKKQLVDGRGNLISLASSFVELGVSVKNELGEEWQEKASLYPEPSKD